jgi:predicted heme/steroid binding protein
VKPLHRLLITIASAVIGLGGVAWALVHVQEPGGTTATGPAQITREALAQHDGKNGNQCYVAIDGTVYLIEGKALWADGRHIPSGGRAMCGQDLSSVIDQAPHGRTKLQQLTVVGTLAP